MRTFHRLRLLCFASTTGNPQSYGFCFTELSTSLLFALSKPWQAHHKRTRANTTSTTTTPIARLFKLSFILISLWWTWGGVEPPSRTHFLLLRTTITCIISQHDRLCGNVVLHTIQTQVSIYLFSLQKSVLLYYLLHQ